MKEAMGHEQHEADTASGTITAHYARDSLSLIGAISMGTGVMIGAGIFALTGQVAELAGSWFPLAFVAAAVVSGFSAYSYVKLSNAFPSAGGVATFLEKAYGKTSVTAAFALLMYFSMVINESLVARTFGTYALRLFNIGEETWLVPALGVGLLGIAFLVNVIGNRLIQSLSLVLVVLKVGGIMIFALAGLWVAGVSFDSATVAPQETSVGGFLGAVALGILAYKGFTTITNSGGEIVDPHRDIGRAIIYSLIIGMVVYVLVALAVAGNLTLEEIVAAKNSTLAEAARPAFGDAGEIFTIVFAVIATASGVIASVFAGSRMLAMLTEMKLVPHRHFGMSGKLQGHTLVYTIVAAMVLTIFFDLSRIAALGAIFYIIMDISIHWGLLRHLRKETGASAAILLTAIVLDVVVLSALLIIKGRADPTVIYVAVAGLAALFGGERIFLRLARH
ncbi:amino acid transporter [Phenylobacterium haematophilum]|jgi:amino acid transporter|uniref:Amino acid transporter n=1 Tax=Phenylobacterium haematophilum TaxID=98513 RepID=A0A840A2X2_9CAUL|nr:APC family permease [Phenylobacterium haematophilum]MBB3892976.1 amino acid transporter [Phenylobacterium haematophilum]